MTTERALPRNYPTDIPATGAWLPGQPVGNRRFVSMADDRPMALEFGGVLRGVTLAYETYGELDAAASNAVLICHALTGDSHVAGPSGPGHPTVGWWDELVGPGKAIDTDRFFVVCVNALGGCQGSTGPASLDPITGQPYGPEFPVVSTRDIVRTQAFVGDHLGVERWHSVIGGSMGGMQVIEWAIMYPDRVASIACIASTFAATAWQIGWSAIGRTALMLDPLWNQGNYYDAPVGAGPHAGLAVARTVAQITYRTDASFSERFGRAEVDSLDAFGLWSRFQVEGYLDHHGQKLARRFDANSYVVLNRVMDLHDVARGRGNLERAVSRVNCPVLVVSISSDNLYHPHLQATMHEKLLEAGVDSEYLVIESINGHDGFLLEDDELGPVLSKFLTR